MQETKKRDKKQNSTSFFPILVTITVSLFSLLLFLAIKQFGAAKEIERILSSQANGVQIHCKPLFFQYGIACKTFMQEKNVSAIIYPYKSLFVSPARFRAVFSVDNVLMESPEGTVAFNFKGEAIRDGNFLTISVSGNSENSSVQVQEKTDLVFVQYNIPKTVFLRYVDEDNQNSVRKLRLPYEIKILDNSYKSCVDSPQNAIDRFYKKYVDYGKKYGFEQANADFINTDGKKEKISKKEFKRLLNFVAKMAYLNTKGSLLEPIYGAYYAAFSKGKKCIEVRENVKKNADPLGLRVSFEMAEINFSQYLKEKNKRYDIQTVFH